MVFNRHLKALNLCNHSHTIACVLYELLVNLELIIVGFQTHVQGSTSFSFVQFSRSCLLSSRTAQSLYQRSYFLSSTFFDIFWSLSASKTPYKPQLQALAAVPSRDSLIIIARSMTFVKHFFRFFWQSFYCTFWQGVYCGDWVGLAPFVGIRGGNASPPPRREAANQ